MNSKREEITRLINSGVCNKDISRIVGCSSSLVSYYKKNTEFQPATMSDRVRKSLNDRYLTYIDLWKTGKISGGGKLGYGKVSNHVRSYIFSKYNSKCSRCGWSQRNEYTNTLPLEIEHINGDPEDHSENNLILLCPNCHSLTEGHSSKKGNGRRYYREYVGSHSGSASDNTS